MQQKYKAYAAAAQTVAKTRQIVLLYDGVIRFMQQAKEAIREKRIEDRYHLLVKASEVISGLQGCLDFENGGDIARLLYGFYASVDARIFAIHRTGSAEACDEIILELREMRDAWQEIDDGSSAASPLPAAPAQAAASPPSPPPAMPDGSVTFSA